MYLIDYHIHSIFSVDGHSSMEEICARALSLGFSEIGFSEHYDIAWDQESGFFFNAKGWFEEIERCQSIFGPQGLSIKAGIELSEPHIYKSECKALLDGHPFDYVIGSLHAVEGQPVLLPEFVSNRSEAKAFEIYFTELERMTANSDFDVLAHFDLPARFSIKEYGAYNPMNFVELIRPVLKTCIERGIAIEINAGSKRFPLKRFTPDKEILALYKEMGGELVTYGSDAHRIFHVGNFISEAMAMLDELGFRSICSFKRRKRGMVGIEP